MSWCQKTGGLANLTVDPDCREQLAIRVILWRTMSLCVAEALVGVDQGG